MVKLSYAELKESASINGLTVVDVYADWCMPCKALKPTLEKLSLAYAHDARFVMIDGETESEFVQEYTVAALPTILFFKNGEVVHRTVGLQSEKTLRDVIDSLIPAKEK